MALIICYNQSLEFVDNNSCLFSVLTHRATVPTDFTREVNPMNQKTKDWLWRGFFTALAVALLVGANYWMRRVNETYMTRINVLDADKTNAVAQANALSEELEKVKADLRATTQQAEAMAVVTTTTNSAFASNIKSLNRMDLMEAAQLALTFDAERVIAKMVEESFDSDNQTAIQEAGRRINAMGPWVAIPIMARYRTDGRVKVEKNVRDWYAKYNPGRIYDMVEKASNPAPAPAKAIVAPAPAKPVRDSRQAVEIQDKIQELQDELKEVGDGLKTCQRLYAEASDKSRKYWIQESGIKFRQKQKVALERELQKKKAELSALQ